MNENTPIVGQLILLAQNPQWSTLVRLQKWPFKLCWALDLDDLESEAAMWPGSLAIIEFDGLNTRNPHDQLIRLAKLANNPYDLCLVAVGDFEIRRWKSALSAVGIAETLSSTTQIQRIGDLARRHFEATKHRSNWTLETRIESLLPWKPIPKT